MKIDYNVQQGLLWNHFIFCLENAFKVHLFIYKYIFELILLNFLSLQAF